MKWICLLPLRSEGNEHMELGVRQGIRLDFFLEHHATQDMTRYHSRNGLYQKDVTSPELFCALYTYGPLRTWTCLQTMLWPNWWHCPHWPHHYWNSYFYYIFSSKVMLLKKDVLKLVQCVCECEQLWRCGVQNIHRSFVGWPGIHSAFPQLPLSSHGASASAPSYRRKPTAARRVSGKKPPEVRRRCTIRRPSARSRLRSFCSWKAPRWPPRTTTARGLKSGKQAPDIESRPT